MTVVLDYGINNLRSVQNAIHHLGFECQVQTNLVNAERLIIPGVGAFRTAMERLEPLRSEISAFAATGQPLLGICLGQQLLFETSEEFGETTGLGLIPGRVRYLPKVGMKVPHIGWSQVTFRSDQPLDPTPGEPSFMYFVHSLYTECEEDSDIAAETEYGIKFPASVKHGNVFGTQFHPEKSGEAGLALLRRFLTC